MKFIQNYHNEHTKIEFGMLIVVILYELPYFTFSNVAVGFGSTVVMTTFDILL